MILHKAYRDGQVRQRKPFAFFPVTTECGKVVWLERVLVMEIYQKGYSNYAGSTDGWWKALSVKRIPK